MNVNMRQPARTVAEFAAALGLSEAEALDILERHVLNGSWRAFRPITPLGAREPLRFEPAQSRVKYPLTTAAGAPEA